MVVWLAILVLLGIGIGMVYILFSKRISEWLKIEGFETANPILKVVGKETISPHTVYTNDYDSGNAKRYLSRLPSVQNGGFSIPDDYTFYKPPDYRDGYEIAVMDAPRTADINRGSMNDPVHLYYQKLYGKLDE